MRRSTLERLDWKDVRYGGRRIVVPARKGKNQERGAIDIADNLASWLAPHFKGLAVAGRQGQVGPALIDKDQLAGR
ncbi:MAG: hypothetical protein JOY92_07760 [Verrucomicrobia bacterium]|nr:hypothetical protein [Verrucomicrobiota bacterium]